MKKHTYTLIAKDGTIMTRTTANTYTHAVIVPGTSAGLHEHNPKIDSILGCRKDLKTALSLKNQYAHCYPDSYIMEIPQINA